jgi:DNA-binding NarL/FixJ family response regulator
VDDHSFIIEGLLARFELERDLECVGAMSDAAKLLEQAKQLKPDIVLLDIEMPEDTDTIIDGIRQVHDGQFCFSPKVQERCQPAKAGKRGKIEPPPSKLDTLTPREQEVLRMIGKGLSRAEIAETMCRSPKTIDGHRESIMEKLGIHDRAELVRFAIREGLVEV